MLRLGLHERGVTEIMAVAEHVVSIGRAAAGLRLRADVPDDPRGDATELIDLAAEPPSDTAATLGEIAAWARTALHTEHVPAFWRALARRPRLLASVWAKHRLVLGAGELDESAKLCLALAVAMNERSDYWTAYFARYGRSAGVFDDEVVVEIAGAVLHYTSFNTIAHGMMLEAPHRDLTSSDTPPDVTARGE